MDDPTLEDYNVGSVVDLVVGRVMDAVSKYPQGNTPPPEADVLLPIGCDFQYENAATMFRNLDKVIHWLNQDGRVNAFYSTPSIYTDAKLSSGKSYTLKTDDYMNYADGPHAYWSGYFVSRAALKHYIRDTSSVFQAAKQVQAVTGGATDMSPSNPLYRLERAMGVTQHHDAVAGTSKQHVAYDYARRLAWGREDADALFNTAFGKLTGYASATYYSCDLSNSTICPALENGSSSTVVLIWNSQAQTKTNVPVLIPVGLPAGITRYAVYGPTGSPVTGQMVPLSDRDTSLRTSYYNYTSTNPTQWLAFQATLPPVGYAAYFIVPSASFEDAPLTFLSNVEQVESGADSQITNGLLTLTFDGSSGQLIHWHNTQTNFDSPLSQTWSWYNASVGNHDDGQASGAYIFRPNSSTAFPVAGAPVTVTLVTGPVLNAARQTFASWLTQEVRLWANVATADIEYTVGPIPFKDGLGKEIVSVFNTEMSTNQTWYTDSNCRDSNQRIYNYRPSWNFSVHEPVAGNYMPVNCFIDMVDINTQNTFSVVTERSQAGASLAEGELEIMVHRRLQHDDGRGVGEPLNETGIDGNGLIIRGIHRLSFENSATAGATRRTAVGDLLYKPIVRYASMPSGMPPSSWILQYTANYSASQAPLPANVQLVTVHSWGPKTLLLRVAHAYEVNEDPTLSQQATVNLANIFTPASGIVFSSCYETTLTGNQPLATAPKITYNVTGQGTVTLPVVPPAPAGPAMTITLDPMDIRTFMCTLNSA
jgi:Glycosyl hydrolases family 38 C-terminal domain/Alpha mannosidase middle domain/Glycosyl hydrolases family 38 C-terminal beta sandwich domain